MDFTSSIKSNPSPNPTTTEIANICESITAPITLKEDLMSNKINKSLFRGD